MWLSVQWPHQGCDLKGCTPHLLSVTPAQCSGQPCMWESWESTSLHQLKYVRAVLLQFQCTPNPNARSVRGTSNKLTGDAHAAGGISAARTGQGPRIECWAMRKDVEVHALVLERRSKHNRWKIPTTSAHFMRKMEGIALNYPWLFGVVLSFTPLCVFSDFLD